MNPTRILLVFAFVLSASALSAAGGGKSSRAHAQARETKKAADAAFAAEKKADPEKAAAKKQQEAEAWVHRPVRHKQTMPAAPTPAKSAPRE
jgi:hypothetical protein